MHFLNLRMQSVLFFIILISITATVVNAGSRKVSNSTFVSATTAKVNSEINPEARSSNSRVGQNYDDEDISKEEKLVVAAGEDTKKEKTKTTDQNLGESATARSCTGGGTGTDPIKTPDLSQLTSLIGGASGIIETVVAVIVILAIIWIKIIAIAVIIYWWVGAKGDKFGDSGSSGYGYGPSKPMYGPPQTQYGTPSAYSTSRSFGDSFNLETLGGYVSKAIDLFTEMNEGTSSSITSSKNKVE